MLVTIQEKTSEGLMWKRVLWNVVTEQMSSESHVVDHGRREARTQPCLFTRPQRTLNTCEWTIATEEHSTTGTQTRGLMWPAVGRS